MFWACISWQKLNRSFQQAYMELGKETKLLFFKGYIITI
jgi:hypothetical protein